MNQQAHHFQIYIYIKARHRQGHATPLYGQQLYHSFFPNFGLFPIFPFMCYLKKLKSHYHSNINANPSFYSLKHTILSSYSN